MSKNILYLNRKVHEVLTPHRANIFSAKFLSETGDNKIVSCAGDGTLLYTDILREEETATCQYTCHAGTVYDVLIIPGDPNTFLSCGEDGTVRWFDLRTKSSCQKDVCKDDILINCGKAVTAISINPLLSYQLAVGCSDSKVRIFDRRQLGTQATGHTPDTTGLQGLMSRFSVPDFGDKLRRLTCVSWRPDGREVLASYSSDYIYVFNPESDCGGETGKKLKVGNPESSSSVGKKSSRRRHNKSPGPVKRLRLRGDWSDTGPHSRPETEARPGQVREESETSQSNTGRDNTDRETYQLSLMQRMTDALSRMLNDPSTRLAMQRLNNQAEAETEVGNENREPRHDPGELGARLRDTRSSEHNTSDDSQQSRAAVAIQDRWRRYRQRRVEAAAENQEENDNDDDDEDHEDHAEAENTEACETTLFCCPNPNNNESESVENREAPAEDTDNTTSADINMTELQDSVADLRTSGVEPAVELRYSDQGTGASTITAVTSEPESLPGPSRVVTGPVMTGVCPTTGARRRRSGISSVPTSAILHDTDQTSHKTSSSRRHMYEYETSDDDSYDEEGDQKIIKQPPVLQQLTGHRNARTMIKEAAWWGTRFIMSGSDCGHMFVWDRDTGEMIMMLEADRHVVNCVQPHPHDPILATSGIDYDVKLWTPTAEQTLFDREQAEVVMRRNEVMLEETRDTITVPASLMIRMLASLNQIRRGKD